VSPDPAGCIGEPISWLRLERYHLGELTPPERADVARHLGSCAACAACIARIEEDAALPLPPLAPPAPETTRRRGRVRQASRAILTAGVLAAAAALLLVVGPREEARSITAHEAGPSGSHGGAGPTAAKGDAIAFSLVRDDDERITESSGVYRDGDRFKALVSCPPGERAAFDLVVYDGAVASFPLDGARPMECGNDVPLPGAFRLIGRGEQRVCLVWSDDGMIDREAVARGPSEALRSRLCKRLRHAAERLDP
jgi:hypothetical protein